MPLLFKDLATPQGYYFGRVPPKCYSERTQGFKTFQESSPRRSLFLGFFEDVFDEADVLIGGEEAVEEGGVFGLVDEADDALEDADEFGEDFVAVDFAVLVQELHGFQRREEAEVVETDFDAGHGA